jgi:hypothetical protein
MSIRRAALPFLALSVLVCLPAGATTISAPTMATASTVAGQALSRPLVDGSWQYSGGVWGATLHSASLPAGSTVVRGSWTTPVVVGKPRQVWFATSFSVTHQGQSAGSSSYFERARVCYPHEGCERQWLSEQADGVPQEYNPSTLPFTVTFGHGISLAWKAHGYPAYVQWQFVQTESGLDEQTDVVQVAVGAKAHTVQST